MTKKDYEAIAELYYNCYKFLYNQIDDPEAMDSFAERENTKSLMFDLMRVFRDSNPKFEWFKFLELTGIGLDNKWRKRSSES